MQYATLPDGTRTLATRDAQDAQCPTCGSSVQARCGQLNIHHWSHTNRTDCDSWSESEGPWHLDWKKNFPAQWHEVTITPHRADIHTSGGVVVELQHSSISIEEIGEREDFYGDMIWVFDGSDFSKRCGVLSFFGEYPHPKFTDGRVSDKLSLADIDMISQRLREGSNNGSIPTGQVSFEEAPKKNRDRYYRDRDIKDLQDRLRTCVEKTDHWRRNLETDSNHPKAKHYYASWLSKTREAESQIRDRESPAYLPDSFPINRGPSAVTIYGHRLSGDLIQFRWSHARKHILHCKKPVIWDVGSSRFLVAWPAGVAEEDPNRLRVATIIDKQAFIMSLREPTRSVGT